MNPVRVLYMIGDRSMIENSCILAEGTLTG